MASIKVENVVKRFGSLSALNGVSFEVSDGEFFTILGPPGAGKTTTLRTIVGLEKPDEGDVYVDGERVTEVFTGDRDIAIMFQNLALYPDKTVYGNLEFPLKQRKVPKPEIERRVNEVATTLKIQHLLKRRPAKLSGGERQRVALGRTIVREPKAYLLDEPISALDALLRLEMRAELKRLQRDLGRTMIYVTHDQVEAMSMADRILVLREGEVQQIGPPEEIYHRPANRFVATVVGSPPMNFLPARVARDGGTTTIEHELFGVAIPGGAALADGASCFVGVRPEDVHIDPTAATGVPATVFATEPLGGETVVDLELADRVVKALASPSLELGNGQRVGLLLDPQRLHVFGDDGVTVVSAAGEDVLRLDDRRGTPAAAVSAATSVAAAVEPDDLTRIEGVGPKLSELLQAAGIRTFAELAATDVARLRQIIEHAGSRFALADPATWPEQAALAAAADWDGLERLQAELGGGRR